MCICLVGLLNEVLLLHSDIFDSKERKATGNFWIPSCTPRIQQLIRNHLEVSLGIYPNIVMGHPSENVLGCDVLANRTVRAST